MTGGAIVIAPATVEVLAAVSALLRETWHATYDAIMGPEVVAAVSARWHQPAALGSAIGHHDRAFLVARLGDRIVGTASATLTAGPVLSIDRLYVLPIAQGRGIGGALYSALEDFGADARTIMLEVHPENARAIAFYEALGFVRGPVGTACGGDAAAALPHMVMLKAAE